MYYKKPLLLIAAIFCLAFALTGCNHRDLSTPSTRIVGHWKFGPIQSCNCDDERIYFRPIYIWFYGPIQPCCYDEYYFAPINDGLYGGNLTVYSRGSAYYKKWEVLSEEKDGETISIQILDVVTPERIEVLNVAKDGLSMTNEYGEKYSYVNDITEPYDTMP